jgi:hypothetical protein
MPDCTNEHHSVTDIQMSTEVLQTSYTNHTLHRSSVECIFSEIIQSQWQRGLMSVSAAARLLRLRIRISPEAPISVCYECCVLPGRDICDGLITRPEESYRLKCVAVCILETFRFRRPLTALGRTALGKQNFTAQFSKPSCWISFT